MNKYVLVENSSKLLKKQLDERYVQVEEEIRSKMKILNETRVEHHLLFQQRTRLIVEEKQYNEELLIKQQYGMTSSFTSTSFFNTTLASPSSHNLNKLLQLKQQKRQLIQKIQSKITKNKRLIDSLENAIQNSQQELRSILVGEGSYYRMSLKVGMDCRDSGLGWVLKSLKDVARGKGIGNGEIVDEKGINGGNNNSNLNHSNSLQSHTLSNTKQPQYEFPLYLDKKSKQFLILKTHLQDQLQSLLQQKRKFVNEIGHATSSSMSSLGGMNHNHHASSSSGNLRNSSRRNQNANFFANLEIKDKIVEDDNVNNNAIENNDIPKKYRRSLKKITILNQQYAQNQSLLEFKPRRSPSKNLQLSTNTDGLTGKKLYSTITEKIRFFDFTKAKKDKTLQLKNNKLMEYQNLLKSIKDIHIKLEDLDIQHENHLTSHYKENKEVFFEQCAACFGYKKSYSMIIKYFSWKNSGDERSSA